MAKIHVIKDDGLVAVAIKVLQIIDVAYEQSWLVADALGPRCFAAPGWPDDYSCLARHWQGLQLQAFSAVTRLQNSRFGLLGLPDVLCPLERHAILQSMSVKGGAITTAGKRDEGIVDILGAR